MGNASAIHPFGACATIFFLATGLAFAEAPTTRPAVSDERTTVLIVPFEVLAGDGARLAEAIQRSLILDISRDHKFHAVEADKVATDRASAVAEARAQKGEIVVWGAVQVAEQRVRVHGEVVDLRHDEPLAQSFKLTGDARDTFELQDLLSEQVVRRIAAGGLEVRADEHIEVPPSQPLRAVPRPRAPDWLREPEHIRDELTYRYNYGFEPYWIVPYGYYCWPYAGYHYSFYRPRRAIYQTRFDDYTYRGLPDRRPYHGFGPRHLRSFDGPVPLRWLRRSRH